MQQPTTVGKVRQRVAPGTTAMRWVLSIALSACMTAAIATAPTLDPSAPPVVIAHRGASGFLPEHTLAAYALAIEMGADYIEPDLVRTKDGHFIALHDIHLEATTDVETVYPDRARADGRYYAIDFTLDEIRALTVHHREHADGRPVFPGRTGTAPEPQRVPTLNEIIALARSVPAMRADPVGLYIEIKNPRFHRDAGVPMEAPLVATLADAGYQGEDADVVIQSFDFDSLVRIREDEGSRLPLVMLLHDDVRLVDAERLDAFARVVDGIGPDKHLVSRVPGLVAAAHDRDLFVHVWTFREDQVQRGFADAQREIAHYLTLGVDGVFTDFVRDAIRAIGER